MRFLHQPGGEHRHQAARQQVGGDHREPDRQRERDKELPADADHEERGNEDGQNAEHGEQPRHGGAAARLHHGSRARNARQHLRVDVLDLDGGLVHQNADREREAAERHDVDGLPASAQSSTTAASSANGMFEHDDQRAAPVAQEDQDHQAGEHRAQQSFDDQAADGVA